MNKKDKLQLPLIERIKTIDNVYEELNKYKPILSNYSFLETEEEKEYALNNQYLTDITLLFNEGWKPNFNDDRQRKYYNWFNKTNLGWVLLYVGCRLGFSYCGSGFYFKDEIIARYCANTFINIYRKVLN